MAIVIGKYPKGYRNALMGVKGTSLEIAGFQVVDTFGTAGSRPAANGTKCKVSVVLPNGDISTLAISVPMIGNAKKVVYGISLNAKQEKIVDMFWASELWCAAIERSASIAKVEFTVDLDSNKANIFLTITTAKGVEATLYGVVNAVDTLALSRDLFVGAGYIVDEKEYADLLALVVAPADSKAA
jgi:hypothetical protein